jgi:hypothetical protein
MTSKGLAGDKGVRANGECFVIMPITDPEGYPENHFLRVYEDLIVPACEKAEFSPIRADDVKATNLIHLDILQRLLHAPMAVCDLSSHNPNVLFELAIRQAFDKPVALIQEVDTKTIFDIGSLRCRDYRPQLFYKEVLEDQEAIAEVISATYTERTAVNSIIRLLSIEAAQVPNANPDETQGMLQILLAEMKATQSKVESLEMKLMKPAPTGVSLASQTAAGRAALGGTGYGYGSNIGMSGVGPGMYGGGVNAFNVSSYEGGATAFPTGGGYGGTFGRTVAHGLDPDLLKRPIPKSTIDDAGITLERSQRLQNPSDPLIKRDEQNC